MRRVSLSVASAVGAALLLVACGGGNDAGTATSTGSAAAIVETTSVTTTATGEAPEGSINALLRANPADDVALVFGTIDYSVGENRISFLVVNQQSELIIAPSATVRVAKGSSLDAVPTLGTTARSLDVGLSEDEVDDGEFNAPAVYVTHLELDEAGTYTLLVEPEGGEIQAVGQIEVAETSAAPGVGDRAIPSDNPTLDDAFAEDITTARPPDTEMLRYSVAESLEEGVPFVVTFATPRFCQSRVCGPVVAIVDKARQELEGSGVRFIHVEIYENNDPQQGFNRWVEEWSLPTEPFTFLVGADGVIRDRFEGLVTVGELTGAVRDTLLR
ncbi:MAG: hypothetical protein U0R69_00710 [Gaiellales bacterium]